MEIKSGCLMTGNRHSTGGLQCSFLTLLCRSKKVMMIVVGSPVTPAKEAHRSLEGSDILLRKRVLLFRQKGKRILI